MNDTPEWDGMCNRATVAGGSHLFVQNHGETTCRCGLVLSKESAEEYWQLFFEDDTPETEDMDNMIQEKTKDWPDIPSGDFFRKAGDWKEDASHENGCYDNHCLECDREFVGHKRRVVCKVCDDFIKAKADRDELVTALKDNTDRLRDYWAVQEQRNHNCNGRFSDSIRTIKEQIEANDALLERIEGEGDV